jgi:AcrR family transcriptional regulator
MCRNFYYTFQDIFHVFACISVDYQHGKDTISATRCRMKVRGGNMNQNAIDTKINLLEAFLRIYENKRIAQVTVKEICCVAGYNRSTFYNHFNDVPSMLNQIEDDTLLIIEGVVRKLTAKEIFHTDAIFAALKGIYQGNQQKMAILMTKPDSHFPQKLKRLMEEIITGFCEDLSGGDNQKLKVAISYHFSAIIGVMAHLMQNRETLDMNQMIDYVKEFSQEGVLTAIKKMV